MSETSINYSVLMAVFKGDKPEFLSESIRSILAQTYRTDDFVIVADGPITPELDKMLQEFSEREPVIRIIHLPENKGLGFALNSGLHVCQHDLVARMDADDIAYPYRMALQLEAFQQNSDLTIVGGFVHEFFDDSNMIISTKVVPTDPEAIRKYGRRRNPFIHPTVMFKKHIVLDLGGYSQLRRGQDYELFIRLLAAGNKGMNISQPLLKFRSSQNMYQRRKSWLSTSTYIRNVYRSWRIGYASLLDLTIAVFMRLTLFLMPIALAKLVYRKIMRKSGN